ncbi:hypothetical protein PUNSTDRAFT_137130 [Punctularia strigosozonata HHB-11173 SS5]|uniref:uncharacterized protein n=1 Tax=Punctularia strigosozonata (strain HHB-11173) TaxID=741275 RepID=UPI000441640C|nr:uncharacterized protein PUNSTDRAFT_137130 [Punctularia strigosozonata HHB-11173 SS5]EIN05636.1 hypothetical protein PUNSTDRAFT_137130 [Punctularia strigosozonata HHB-11173 SS5]
MYDKGGHQQCQLAQLHSDAVDFQKSGRPVPMSLVPRLLFRAKPDWNAPETIQPDRANFYTSTKAIGKLFREIQLPSLEDAEVQGRPQWKKMARQPGTFTLEDAMDNLSLEDDGTDPISIVLRARISEFLDADAMDEIEDAEWDSIGDLFERYTGELHNICAHNSLVQGRRWTSLTEEEVLVGTIVAKTSQPRKRKEVMGKMREQATILVNGVRSELSGDDNTPMDNWLKNAWVAWQFAATEEENDVFGSKSFGIIAIGSILEAIRTIEDSLRNDGRTLLKY